MSARSRSYRYRRFLKLRLNSVPGKRMFRDYNPELNAVLQSDPFGGSRFTDPFGDSRFKYRDPWVEMNLRDMKLIQPHELQPFDGPLEEAPGIYVEFAPPLTVHHAGGPPSSASPVGGNRQRRRFSILLAFKRFVRGPAREDVELTIASLKKDVREMEQDGDGVWSIRCVVFWATANTIVPILWSGVRRWAMRILIADWIRRFTGH